MTHGTCNTPSAAALWAALALILTGAPAVIICLIWEVSRHA
jgi:hypothetical protein